MTLSTMGAQVFNHKALLVIVVMASLLLATVSNARAATVVSFTNFTDPSVDFQLNGVTSSLNPNSDDVLRLTNNYGQAGSAFLKTPISLAADASFSAAFLFQIHDSQSGGADGLVFVVQTVSNTAGGGGGGIGYKDIANSVGIEFDTWHNGDGGACDINSNHVGINLSGNICSVEQVGVGSLGQ